MFSMLSVYFAWGQVHCRWLVCLIVVTLCFTIAQSIAYAEPPPWSPEPDSNVISSVIEKWDPRRGRISDTMTAEELVMRTIKGGKGINGAADLIARTYNLSKPLAREFVVLVIAREWFVFPPGRHRSDKMDKFKRIRERFVSLVKKSEYNPDILAAARVYIFLGNRCSPDTFYDLVSNAPEPMTLGFELAQTSYCHNLLAQLNRIEPGNRALAWAIATGSNYYQVRPARRLALLEDLSKRMQVSSANDPEYLNLFLECLSERDRVRKVELYEQLATLTTAPSGGLWEETATAILPKSEVEWRSGVIEDSLEFWERLVSD